MKLRAPSREWALRLWEMSQDFGEEQPITKIEAMERYGFGARRWDSFKVLGKTSLFGFKVIDFNIYLYRGTGQTCATILDNYITKYERLRADKFIKNPVYHAAVYEEIHKEVKCPACGADPELHCVKGNGQIDLHVSRIEKALVERGDMDT